MSLNQLINKPVIPLPINVPRSLAFEHAVKAIQKRWPDVVVVPEEKEAEKLLLRLLTHIDTWDWEEVTLSFICSTLSVAFNGKFSRDGRFKKIHDFFLNEISLNTNSIFLNTAVGAYIRDYDPNNPRTVSLGERLLGVKNQLMNGKWKDILEQYPAFFNGKTAHKEIAQHMLRSQDPWTTLKSLGLSPHESGLMGFAHSEFVKLLAPNLDKQKNIERLIDWLKQK